MRLITSYVDAKGEPVGQCTGLGVVVRSWTAQNANDQKNNWVLTDGSLVNPGPNAACIASQSLGELASIQIMFSNLYNLQPISFTINAPALDVRCQQPGCSNGPALFPFPSDSAHTQPFVDVATADQRQVASIMLTKNTTSTEIPSSSNTDARRAVEYTQQIVPQYLTPIQSPQINAPSNQQELGTPIINSAGELTGMHLNSTGSFTADDIRAFITSKVPELNNSPVPHLNPLHDSWNRGIAAYYQKDYTTARVAFQTALLANPQFEAAQTFAQLSSAAAASSENNGRTAGQQSPAGITIGNLFIPLWLLIVIGLSGLIALFVMMSLTFRHARAKRKLALKAEYAEAERQVLIDVQRIVEAERTHLPTALLSAEASIPARLPTPELEEIEHKVASASSRNIEQVRNPEHYRKQSNQADEVGVRGLLGQRLGNYRLTRLLGHGGFADVYCGEHIFLKTQAAIKVLRFHQTPEELSKFIAEARVIASLAHPSIVRVLEFGVEGTEPNFEQSAFEAQESIAFLIMDYAPHGTLRQRYPKGTRVPLSTVIFYVECLAEALYYAHQRKVIHRDIKPENMLLGRHNEILLSDFGIAAVAHSEHSMMTQEMAGTIPYTAPEQIRGKPRPASDQYALGIVVYEWLCGSRPFQGTTWEIIAQHLTTPPPSLRKKIPALSPSVEEVVMKALAKDHLQRFENVQAFASALTQAAKFSE